jgi:two-component system sensor kinase FixL
VTRGPRVHAAITSSPDSLNRIPPRDIYITLTVAVVLALLTAVGVRISSAEAERERAESFAMSVERLGNGVRGALSEHVELVERWRNVLAVSPGLGKVQLDGLFRGARQKQLYAGIGPTILAVPGRPGTVDLHRSGVAGVHRPYAVVYSMGSPAQGSLARIDLGRSPAFAALEARPAAEQVSVLRRLPEFDALAAATPALVVPVLAADGNVGCWIVVWMDFAAILQRVGSLQAPAGYSMFMRQSAVGGMLGGWNAQEGPRPAMAAGSAGTMDATGSTGGTGSMGSAGVPASRFSTFRLDFAGESLEVSVSAPEGTLYAADAEWPMVIGILGSVLVLVGTLGTFSLLSRRRESGEMQLRLAGQLQAGEQRFRDLVETTPDWVWETDRNGLYTYCSPSCAALFGYAPEDIVGTRGELIWGAGSPASSVAGVKLRVARHRSGRRITLESSAVPIRGLAGEAAGLRGFDRDVSRRVALEEELRLLQSRLIGATQAESVGQAMVGLAHELNQPLAAVVTYNQACLRMVESDQRINPDIREAMRATASHALLASDIVRKFRDLVGGRRISRSSIRIEDVVKHAVDIASTRKSREKVRLNVNMANDLPEVSGDATLLVQVVLNLLNNAMDAVASSRIREITVNAFRDTGDTVAGEPVDGDPVAGEPKAGVPVDENLGAGKVRVEVTDTGGGLDEVARTQMFEPYFTTKLDGVGMGLAVCRSIIQAHGEEINAGTTGDGRTVFWFTLAAGEAAHA